MQRRPQQQTLSIRIPESLRDSLERTREVISNHHRYTSTADVAKLLLESAIDDGLDERVEMADLRARPTAALGALRRKWEQNQDLSRAEWLFLAHYVQAGCEELAEDPGLPKPESFAQALEALLAVRALRVERGTELDRYYLGNLGQAEVAPLKRLQLDADLVPKAVAALVHELRQSAAARKPVFVGRSLFVALRDESLEGIAAVNRALSRYWPVLYGLAARGHYLREHRPVRVGNALDSLLRPNLPCVMGGDPRVSMRVTNDGELKMLIEMSRKQVVYPLRCYPRIREFASMLERLEPGGYWKGREFLGCTTRAVPDQATCFSLRHRGNGITVSLAAEEWQSLREGFQRALALPELQPVLAELSLAYGEM